MKKEKRKIPTKNYIKLALIFIFTLIVVFYANSWYKTYQINKLNTPYISGKIKAINKSELDTYLVENPNLIIYVGKNNDQKCYDFEKELYSAIKKSNLIEETVFLDLSDNYSSDILDDIQDKYYSENITAELNNLPALLIIQDKQIKDVLIVSNDEKISSDSIIQLFEEFEYIK